MITPEQREKYEQAVREDRVEEWYREARHDLSSDELESLIEDSDFVYDL